jgi:hypothetical protein
VVLVIGRTVVKTLVVPPVTMVTAVVVVSSGTAVVLW